MQGPVNLNVKPEALKSKGLSVALLDTAALAYLDKTGEFCCTPLLVDSGRCKSADELTVPGSFRFPVNKDTLKNGFSKSFKPPKTGLYYVAVVNCDSVAASDSGPVSFTTGELETVGKSGYLPGRREVRKVFVGGGGGGCDHRTLEVVTHWNEFGGTAGAAGAAEGRRICGVAVGSVLLPTGLVRRPKWGDCLASVVISDPDIYSKNGIATSGEEAELSQKNPSKVRRPRNSRSTRTCRLRTSVCWSSG